MKKRNNRNSTALFLLIKSMTGPEKRYFIINSAQHVIGDQNNYVQLFKAIEKQKEPNDEELLTLFRNQTFTKQLHRTKNYLYELIVASLSRYSTERNAKHQVSGLLSKAEVLYAKGLYLQCNALLLKAKKIAKKYENYLQLVEITGMERRIFEHDLFHKMTENDLKKNFKERNNHFLYLKTLFEYQEIVRRLQFYSTKLFRTKNELHLQAASAYEDLHRLRKTAPFLSDEIRREYYLGLILYYSIVKEHRKHYISCARYLQIVEGNDFYIVEHPLMYIGAISNFLSAAINLNKFDGVFHSYIHKLEHIHNNPHHKTFKTNDVQATVFARLYINKLLFYEQSGQFESGTETAQNIYAGLTKYKHNLGAILRSVLHFNLACNFFGAEKYHDAIQLLSKITNTPGKDKDLENLGYYSKMVAILSHLELGNYALLEYMITSLYKKLKESRNVFTVEIAILRAVKKVISKNENDKDLIKCFKSVRDEVLIFLKNKDNKERISYFNYLAWIESKISKRSFAEMIRR